MVDILFTTIFLFKIPCLNGSVVHKCLENLELSIVRSSLCECVPFPLLFPIFRSHRSEVGERENLILSPSRGEKVEGERKRRKRGKNEQKQLVCLSHFLPHPQGPLSALLIDFGHSANKLPKPFNLGIFHYALSIRSIFPLSPFQYTTDATRLRRRVTPPPPASVYAETCVTSRLGRE